MKRIGTALAASILTLFSIQSLRAADYILGADLSFLGQAEARGAQFKENNQPKPALQIFRDHGYNYIRLRLFNNPTQLPNNLVYTLALAQSAKKLGYKFLLDYHYSDTWADPGKQFLPKAWEGKSHPEIVQALQEYTRDTIQAFREGGAMPDMVQIGNEITGGMCWPDGKLPNWDNFTDLLKAGIRGVDDGRESAPRPKIMIHIDRGGDQRTTKSFFANILSHGIEFDIIGQSYYPWWHGSLLDLRDNLAFMAQTYHKDIIVVEAAYNWRPSEYARANQPGPFPETPEGQAQFWEEVNRTVMAAPDNRGKGVFWWEAAVAGGTAQRGMFDANLNALPSISIMDKFTRGKLPPTPPRQRPTTAPASQPQTTPRP